jgi:hypothetical protein
LSSAFYSSESAFYSTLIHTRSYVLLVPVANSACPASTPQSTLKAAALQKILSHEVACHQAPVSLYLGTFSARSVVRILVKQIRST